MSADKKIHFCIAYHVSNPVFGFPKIPLGIYVTDEVGEQILDRVEASKFPSRDYLGASSHILMKGHVEDFEKAKTVSELWDRGPHVDVSNTYTISSDTENTLDRLREMLP